MTESRCETCNGHGFVRDADEVLPCPRCNDDSGYRPGEYEIELLKKHGRCGYSRGGGGRTCYRFAGHKPPHIFECGR